MEKKRERTRDRRRATVVVFGLAGTTIQKTLVERKPGVARHREHGVGTRRRRRGGGGVAVAIGTRAAGGGGPQSPSSFSCRRRVRVPAGSMRVRPPTLRRHLANPPSRRSALARDADTCYRARPPDYGFRRWRWRRGPSGRAFTAARRVVATRGRWRRESIDRAQPLSDDHRGMGLSPSSYSRSRSLPFSPSLHPQTATPAPTPVYYCTYSHFARSPLVPGVGSVHPAVRGMFFFFSLSPPATRLQCPFYRRRRRVFESVLTIL